MNRSRVRVVLWLGALAAGVREEGTVRHVPLATLWDPLSDDAIDLGEAPADAASAARLSRFTFTVDEDAQRIWFMRAPLDLDRRTNERKLLLVLLKNAGRWVPRGRLYAKVWGADDADDAKLETRLRQLKQRLVKSLGDDRIVQTRSGSDAEGGLRLDVAPEHIWWSSLADGDREDP